MKNRVGAKKLALQINNSNNNSNRYHVKHMWFDWDMEHAINGI